MDNHANTRMSFKRVSLEDNIPSLRRAAKYEPLNHEHRERNKQKELYGEFVCPNANKSSLATTI